MCPRLAAAALCVPPRRSEELEVVPGVDAHTKVAPAIATGARTETPFVPLVSAYPWAQTGGVRSNQGGYLLKVTGQPEQRGLIAVTAHEMHADGQPFLVPV